MELRLVGVKQNAMAVLVSLLALELVFVVIYLSDLVVNVPRPVKLLFDLDGEGTIPSWFSSTQLFVIGLLLVCSATWPNIRKVKQRRYVVLGGLVLIYLSMDEALMLHEAINFKVLKPIPVLPDYIGNRGLWMVAYGLVIAGLVILTRRSVLSFIKIYPAGAKMMLLGTAIFLLGAVGLELYTYIYPAGPNPSIYYEIQIALEEFFEMAGASLILYGTFLCGMRPDTQG